MGKPKKTWKKINEKGKKVLKKGKAKKIIDEKKDNKV